MNELYLKFLANSFVPVMWCHRDVSHKSAILLPHNFTEITYHVAFLSSYGGDSKMAPLLYALYGLASIIMAGWIFVWLIHITAFFYAKWRLHRKVEFLPRETPYPGVSIIKPLVGVDPNLFSNLETFFTTNYPLFELLFCINDESDPSIMLVKRLMEKYPNVDARIFIGGAQVGVNPKINNMQPGYAAAKYDLFMVSDSGLRMKEDTLLDMVNHMTDNVGLVHQMPFVCDRKGFAATLEKIYFGTSHARIYLVADFLRINCATGMSALMRKNLLDEVGGIKAFGHYLAEDFFFAKSMIDRGWRIRICSQPAWQNSGVCDISSFQVRIARWTKLRFAMVPQVTLLEPFSECMLMGALSSFSATLLFQWDPFVFYLVHILVWFLLDWILLGVLQNGPIPFSKFDFVIGWMLRECSVLFLFCKAIFDPTIRWRTGTYKLKWGGQVEVVKTKL